VIVAAAFKMIAKLMKIERGSSASRALEISRNQKFRRAWSTYMRSFYRAAHSSLDFLSPRATVHGDGSAFVGMTGNKLW